MYFVVQLMLNQTIQQIQAQCIRTLKYAVRGLQGISPVLPARHMSPYYSDSDTPHQRPMAVLSLLHYYEIFIMPCRNKEESAASTAEKGLSRTLGTLGGRATMV